MAEFQLKCCNPFYSFYADPSAMLGMKGKDIIPLKLAQQRQLLRKN